MFKSLIVASLLAISTVSFSAEGENRKHKMLEGLTDAQKAQVQEIHQLRAQLRSKRMALIESVKISNPELAERMLKRVEMRKDCREEMREERKEKRQGRDIRREVE